MPVSVIENPYAYKLIYVFRSPEAKLKGLLKIGDATLPCTLPREAALKTYPPNCQALNDAANARIRGYMGTSGMAWQLLYTTLAFYDKIEQGEEGAFRDFDVHGILRCSGHPKVVLEGTKAREWFRIPLPVAISAIQAAKARRAVLSAKESNPTFIPVTLWPNQREAVDLAKTRFEAGAPTVLWNAKMRFGKTISAMTLIKEQQYGKVLICTHRPVVRKGWKKEYLNVFGDSDAYVFLEDEAALAREHRNVIYFASIQDLRGSSIVKGKFSKNETVFNMDWDLVIIDEAHEGTQTDLGTAVIHALTRNKRTKILALSGTPYNLLDDFPIENTYTWDYVAERKTKQAWDKTEGCANPYASLPEMRLLTYALSEEFLGNEALVTLDNSFSFSEFFRVRKTDGRFVHEGDVKKFLALLRGADPKSNYPFATEEYRKALKHTLWKLPGVPECDALEKLLEDDPLFGNFEVVNVAGEGDGNKNADSALDSVNAAIATHEYTITLSCGRLTTGVTVPQWTGVLMLSGGDKIAAAAYLQTIFRVQSPYTDEAGRVKERCYAFDFAPDRLLTILPEMCIGEAIGTRKRGDPDEPPRSEVSQLLNFLPIIAVKGSELRGFRVDDVFYAIKRSTAAKAIREGFNDDSIYRKEMLTDAKINPEDFKELEGIIGTLSRNEISGAVPLSQTGVNKPKRTKTSTRQPRTPDPEREKREKERQEREKNISILRGISIRIPLLIYGAEGPHDEDIGIRDFMQRVDPTSWEEFMPKGVTWEVFEKFIPYYDDEVFRIAVKEIRTRARAADSYSPEGRVKVISAIFLAFRNPDKETVLTPWRTVNIHLTETVGGWCFYDEAYKETLDAPRYVEHEGVTERLFKNPKSKVLEINSKSGLYPLWIAFSFYQERCAALRAKGETLSRKRQQSLWREVVRENLFIVCKTRMAKSITLRTLLGYGSGNINLKVCENLILDLREKAENDNSVLRYIQTPSTWGLKGTSPVHFDAIVGNPPYQAQLGGASPLPVYHHFVELAIAAADLVTLITPSRWFNTGSGLDGFREARLQDTHLRVLHDFRNSKMLFDTVDIKGGVNYFLWDRDWDGKTELFLHESATEVRHSQRYLLEPGLDIFVRDERALPILRKVLAKGEEPFSSILSAQDPFGFDIRQEGSLKRKQHEFAARKSKINSVTIYYNGWRKEGIKYVPRDAVGAHSEWVDRVKLFLPKVWGTGDPRNSRIPAFIVEPPSVCTETYITLTPFKTREEAENALAYVETKFFHFLVGIRKTSQNGAKGVYGYVPLQDFSREWTDAALYEKYGLTAAEVAFIEATIPDAAAKQPTPRPTPRPKR